MTELHIRTFLSNSFTRRTLLAVVLMALSSALLCAQSASTIPAGVLVQPDALHSELLVNPHATLILQVGSRMLFDEAHIPGAEYAGPASTPAGLGVLRTRVNSLSRGASIVLYCGCCPWSHCPNIAPAWNLLHDMGFTSVRVLYIANNFGTDWVAHGYGAERSQ
jgi:3-mercaptopyruvate sulfurtransferase SseA